MFEQDKDTEPTAGLELRTLSELTFELTQKRTEKAPQIFNYRSFWHIGVALLLLGGAVTSGFVVNSFRGNSFNSVPVLKSEPLLVVREASESSRTVSLRPSASKRSSEKFAKKFAKKLALNQDSSSPIQKVIWTKAPDVGGCGPGRVRIFGGCRLVNAD